MKNRIKILKIIMILAILVIVILIKIFLSKNFLKQSKMDDFLFLKIFQNSPKDNANGKDYNFRVHYENMSFKSINFADTIKKDTVLNGKIAPGMNGKFNVILNSNQDLYYKVEFESINEKPQNLNFVAIINGEKLIKANTLEELGQGIYGKIEKGKKINITVLWYWPYENEKNMEEVDNQDTYDGENIKKYQFNVCVLGEEAYKEGEDNA